MTLPRRPAKPEIRVFPTPSDVARGAGELFVEVARDAVEQRGHFLVALAGGSTPRDLYAWLAEHAADSVRWPRLRVFFGDERCVPPDHPDSNFRMAHENLLRRVNVCPNCVHRIPTKLPPVEAADDYETVLRDELQPSDGRFDLVLLGLGDDGHTASLFPHSPALWENTRWCVYNRVQHKIPDRVTLTFPILNAARQVLFLVVGSNKAAAIERVLSGPTDLAATPAQGLEPSDGRVTWFLDSAAAALLDPTT